MTARQMRKSTKRRPFTLLELFVCLAIIAIASTFLGIKGYDLLQQARFSSASGKIATRLKECRSLALAHGEDVVLFLKNEKDRTICLTGFESGVLREEKLDAITIQFNDEPVDTLLLRFYSTGNVQPLGKLQIISKKKEERSQISFDLGALLDWEEGEEKN